MREFLDDHKVPYGVIDSTVFAESRGTNPAPLMHWMWAHFMKDLTNSICRYLPNDGVRCSKFKHCEVRNPTDLYRLLKVISFSETDFNPEGRVKCIAVLVKEYQELLAHEPALLNMLLRLHEKLAHSKRRKCPYRKKVVVILMGPYPAPPEAIRNNSTIPSVYFRVLTPHDRAGRIIDDNKEYAINKGKELLPQARDDDIEFLFDGFVRYLVDVVYQWYSTDPESLDFYSRLLWPHFLEPFASCGPDALEDLEGIMSQLCRGVDGHVRHIIRNYRSRFISDLKDTSMAEGDIVRKQLYKFHGSRLAKYILMGATMAALSEPSRIRHRLHGRKIQKVKRYADIWRSRRCFDIMAWISNTEWVYTNNEPYKLLLDNIFYDQLLWVIDEGYVKPLSNINVWKMLPVSRSSRFWRIVDRLPSADLPWREHQYHPSNVGIDVYMNHMMSNSSRFLLCASKELILSVAQDLDIDLNEYIVL